MRSSLPTVALVGRPNVGKSTLFNRLCRSRRAVVADFPGLTRDRHYGRATLGDRVATLVDTGGLAPEADAGDVFRAMAEQARLAIDEADLVVLVVDAQAGVAVGDQEIVRELRRRGKAALVAANKTDGAPAMAVYEFARLGLGEALPVSATKGRGLAALGEAVAERLGSAPAAQHEEAAEGLRIGVVGRPNVGKSTLVNRFLGSERQVVHAAPGTTRDAIDIPFGDDVLIDTAGVRRKGRTMGAGRAPAVLVERHSVVRTLDALDRAHAAIVVVDGSEGVVDQDLHVLGYALEAGAGVVLAVNKWDALDVEQQERARQSVSRHLAFAPWIPVRHVSALRGTGADELLRQARAICAAGAFEVRTSELNRILAAATRQHPPPAARSRPIKLRYAHKGGSHPPTVAVYGNQTSALPRSYLRYLENVFRDELGLVGLPVRVQTHTTENPYAGRRNTLNERQRKARKRVIRHRKRK